MTKWTEQDFLKFVGRNPIQDDLDRVNCDKAGTSGHHSCGICEHNLPVFECQVCFAKPFDNVKRI